MSAGSQAAPLNPGIVFDMVQAHQRTAALEGGHRTGHLRAVGPGAGRRSVDRAACSASERGIRILCDFLVINGVLAKENGHYKHTPSSAAFLDPVSPACMASVAQFLSRVGDHAGRWATWPILCARGARIFPARARLSRRIPFGFVRGEDGADDGADGRPLGAMVLKGQTGRCACWILRRGTGCSGSRSRSRIRRRKVTGLDWAPVLRVALKNAEKAGVKDRYDMLPGSAFEVEFGGPYDVVLLTNFLHHFDKPTNVGLLKKVRAALKPGGCAATLEFVPNPGSVSPPMPAAFAMTMLTTTAEGDAYTFPS
jgi:hypothetical protein